MGSVGVVTFDLWDCLFHDDSDEPKRAAAGLPPKPVARRALLHEALSRECPIDRASVDLAFDVADAAFRKVWHDQYFTWTVRERLEVLLSGLGRSLPEPALAEVVDAMERMELEYRPDPAPHAVEALAALSARYPLAIVSDAIFTPGRNLRVLLREDMKLEELVRIAEDEASCEVFGLLKRPDEKWVTERAYDNPKFVEDLVRDIALRLMDEPRIAEWKVISENFESIHNHSAYAELYGSND